MIRGAKLFKKQCASCHQLFGEGGKIGPDITGAQRMNLDYMLENIIDPSAVEQDELHIRLKFKEASRDINLFHLWAYQPT